MAGKKTPKSKPVAIELSDEQIEKKPENMTMTEWKRALIDNHDRFSDVSTFKVIDETKQ